MIFVFKTSIKTNTEVKNLSSQLDKLASTCQWNFDLEDSENILRIDSKTEIADTIINLLQENGFDCEELPD